MISITVKQSKKTAKEYLKHLKNFKLSHLDQYGVEGVNALAAATPIDTGTNTASSWDYKILMDNDLIRIVWTNSNVVKGQNIAILLQYGHGTRNGGYVQGRDYINPAMRPVFDDIANRAWLEVTKNG